MTDEEWQRKSSWLNGVEGRWNGLIQKREELSPLARLGSLGVNPNHADLQERKKQGVTPHPDSVEKGKSLPG